MGLDRSAMRRGASELELRLGPAFVIFAFFLRHLGWDVRVGSDAFSTDDGGRAFLKIVLIQITGSARRQRIRMIVSSSLTVTVTGRRTLISTPSAIASSRSKPCSPAARPVRPFRLGGEGSMIV